MKDFEEKLRHKLTSERGNDISLSSEERMWSGIDSEIKQLPHGPKHRFLKVVYSKTVPVMNAPRRFSRALTIGLISLVTCAVAGYFFIYPSIKQITDKTSVKNHHETVVPTQNNSIDNKKITNQPILNNVTKNAMPESQEETPQSIKATKQAVSTITNPINLATDSAEIITPKAHSSKTQETALSEASINPNNELRDDTITKASTADSVTNLVLIQSTKTKASDSVINDSTDIKETITAQKQKTIIIQETEERVIKKRVPARKQAKRK